MLRRRRQQDPEAREDAEGMLDRTLGRLEDGSDRRQKNTTAEGREELQGMQLIGQEVVQLETFAACCHRSRAMVMELH